MKKPIAWVLAGLVMLALLMLLPRPSEQPESTHSGKESVDLRDAIDETGRRGALVDEVVFTQESDVGKIAGLIERGRQQVFAQGITNITAYQRLRDSRKGDYETAYGSNTELSLNPAEFEDGLNPFRNRRIREAMNWLVDRRHVAEEIYGGMAVPRYLPMNTAFPDYARLAETARSLELKYGHDPEKARRIIEQEMKTMGASRRDGQWYHEGKPVTLKILIRTEDARKQVGDYVGNLMSGVGFNVRRQYRTAQEASRIWIASDPASGQWHIYTGSWVSTAINRDVSSNLSFYYTDRGRPDPLWQAYDPSETLDNIARRLQRRDYTSMEERRELMAEGMELAMEESYRIWLVDQLSIIPRAANVALAADLAGGIAGSRMWPYTLRYKDRLGGSMTFAAPSMLTEPWNPVAGSNWLFDTMITRALNDPPMLPDPYTGLYRPQSIQGAEVTVTADTVTQRTHDWVELKHETSIEVPADAWIGWNAEENRLRTVADAHPDGTTARSRTRIRYEEGYLDGQWHDGTEMSLADLVLPWILNFARADENSPFFDPSHVPRFQVFQQYFKGWRIVQREPLVIEVYSDQVFPDAETIVAQQALSPLPWHMLALSMRAEKAGDLAFSSHKADANRVPWLSLVSGPSLETLERHLGRARDQGYLPYASVLGDMTAGENPAQRRYSAIQDWYRERGHFWVGNGPFYLHSVHPVEKTVVLRRNKDFPDPADKWLDVSEAAIPEVTLEGPMMVTQGESAAFNVKVTFGGETYPEDAITSLEYLLYDADGNLQARGQAEPAGGGQWRVSLTADTLSGLDDGANSLEVAVTSSRVALPAFASHAFATVPEGTRLMEVDDE
ncbi:ABC transporter substrate-binding protein [Salicola sp. Rm-C-2C1-2]|uniref:ABC transporter substrate-binding protein n=1 Tax=Salicola sp. Rm-C-2C1-2 TaxID=3141321 RepID=UPI0032E3CFEA